LGLVFGLLGFLAINDLPLAIVKFLHELLRSGSIEALRLRRADRRPT